jgi:excisionase family DNA binding protein
MKLLNNGTADNNAPWTIKEVAAYLKCSERNIHNLVADGLPHFRVRRLLRFWPEEVRGYFQR